jgi:DTW domain-containing protein YfiP
VQPIDSVIEFVILQHPTEVFQSKGTGRLLHLCMKNSQILVGETFDETQRAEIVGDASKQCVLLFPKTPNDKLPEVQAGIESSSREKRRVILLDGTWRKARKMLKLNPWLEALPRIDLPPTESLYRIRKAQKPGQLSTLEAAYWTMKQAGEEPHELLSVFERFMNKQANWQGTHKTE